MIRLALVSLSLLSAPALASGGGTCWYFNGHTRSIVDYDAFGRRHSCDPRGNWYEQCRDRRPVTREIACRWHNMPAPTPSDMPVGGTMPGESGGSTPDMPSDGGMGTGGSWGGSTSDMPVDGGMTGAPTVPTLSSLGIRATNGRQAIPGNWQTLKTLGVKVEPSYQACNWVTRPSIYAFPDGVVYANAAESDINVFDHQTVRKFGCLLPAINGVSVQAPVTEPLNPTNTYSGEGRRYVAGSLASFGVVADDRGHGRDGRFEEMVSKAVRISQADHGCKWAVLPLIYVFTDGIAYASIGGTELNIFSHQTARNHGCFVPSVFPETPSSPVPTMPDDMNAGGNMDAGGFGADGLGSMGSDVPSSPDANPSDGGMM
jgi:hypothetical protein